MANIWQPLPIVFPADGATVWIRRLNAGAHPFQATWSTGSGLFTDPVSGQTLPWWIVINWRPV